MFRYVETKVDHISNVLKADIMTKFQKNTRWRSSKTQIWWINMTICIKLSRNWQDWDKKSLLKSLDENTFEKWHFCLNNMKTMYATLKICKIIHSKSNF